LITSIVAFIVVLGIVISVHEFGHFAMAKLLKIRVLVFSLGFGPKLLGFTRGGTEYRLSPIPLGGYVKMAGENYDEDRVGAPDEFLSHPKRHRFLVALSGPFMNILLSIVIFTFIFLAQGVYEPKYFSEPPVVGPITSNSVAGRAGLQTGDLVLSVSGNAVHTWEDMEVALTTASKDSIDVEVLRDNRKLSLNLNARDVDMVESAALGFKPRLSKTIVNEVLSNSPAEKAGLQAGDQILSVRGNGKTGDTYSQILNIISESKGIPLTFEVFRPKPGQEYDPWETPTSQLAGDRLRMTITPTEKDGQVLIGFNYAIPGDMKKFRLDTALAQSIQFNYDNASLTFRIIGRMLKGSASVRTLSGPIGIAQISGEAARSHDITVFIRFIGLISLQLGIFNLLPIPILDGGVIALLLIEGLMRRELSLNLKEKIVQAGFVFLILLMGFAVLNDLSKIINFERIFG
jgi:regulator of sigma E protease